MVLAARARSALLSIKYTIAVIAAPPLSTKFCSALCAEVESGVIALKSEAATPIPRRATAISSEAQDSLPPINDLALAANRA